MLREQVAKVLSPMDIQKVIMWKEYAKDSVLQDRLRIVWWEESKKGGHRQIIITIIIKKGDNGYSESNNVEGICQGFGFTR